MRGESKQQSSMFSYVTLEQRIPAAHPIRQIRAMVDEAFGQMGYDVSKRSVQAADESSVLCTGAKKVTDIRHPMTETVA